MLEKALAIFDEMWEKSAEYDRDYSIVRSNLLEDLADAMNELRATLNPKDYVVQQLVDGQFVTFNEYTTFQEAEEVVRKMEYGAARIYIKSLNIYSKGVLYNG